MRLRDRFTDRHGAAIADHGEFDTSAGAVNREVARAASVAPGPVPAPPTAAEFALLGQRLRFDAIEVARRERDVRIAYAEHIEAALRAERERAHRRIEDLERLCSLDERRAADARQELASVEAALHLARVEVHETHLALQDALRTLDQLSSSRSWRYTRWLRRLRRPA
jgi:hypothetical protein